MADLLKTGLAWLTDQLKTYASQTVTYTRGYDSAEVPATFGSKLLKLFDEFGAVRLERTDMDFLIPADDLLFDGERVTPQRGDLITITMEYDIQTFEIMPLDDVEPPWRWTDPHQSMYRIHTKHIKTEPYG